MVLKIIMKLLILATTFFSINLLAKDYFINFHAKNIINEKHDYSKGNYYNILKLDGSFTDNLGNYGNFNALASVELSNNKIKQHFVSAEITYQNEAKIYAQGSRTSEEFEQGTGILLISSTHNSLNELLGTKCIYGINFFKNTSFTSTKCDITDESVKQLMKVKDQ